MMQRLKSNPYLTLWWKPRTTFQQILTSDPKEKITLFALIYGLVIAFNWLGYLWTTLPSATIYKGALFISFLLVMGLIVGLLSLYFGGWLYRWVGSWLGGKGGYLEVRAAVGWSLYPYIISGLLSLLSYLLVSYPVIELIVGVVNFIILVWACVVFIFLLAEAHRFSFLRALCTTVIAVAFVFFTLMLLSFFLTFFQSFLPQH